MTTRARSYNLSGHNCFGQKDLGKRARKVSWMCLPTGIQGVAGLILGPATYLSYRFGQETIFTAILSLLLIQVEQLSSTGESMDT